MLTIDGLLNNTQRAEHPDYEPDLNFKKAKGSDGSAAAFDLINADGCLREAYSPASLAGLEWRSKTKSEAENLKVETGHQRRA